MGTANDLVVHIVNAGLGTYGTNLFKGSKVAMPPGDGPYISVVVSGGTAPEGTHNDGKTAYVRPSCQVMVRAKSYETAEVRAGELFSLISKIRDQFINGTWWRSVTMIQSEPFDFGPDEVGRPRFVFNLNIVKRSSPATS